MRFIGGLKDRRGVHQAVARGLGLISGRLGAEAAILGTTTGFYIYNGAKVNFVAFEMFADTVSPGEEIEDIGARFEIEEPERVFAANEFALEHTASEVGNSSLIAGVK